MVLSAPLAVRLLWIACALGDAACGKVASIDGDPGTSPVDAAATDAVAIDAPSSDATTADASLCFGKGIVRVCLAAAPTGQLTPPATINTSLTSTACAPTTNASAYCVVAAATITVTGMLRATGSRPLVLLASEQIKVNAPIDVSSRRNTDPGAGADPAVCNPGTAPATAGSTSGGGAGGSFTRLGGHGGDGASMSSGGLAGAAVLPASVTTLRGGCPGQAGAGASRPPGGHGGGAVFLIAGNEIDVDSAIGAGGQGGGGAPVMAQGGGGGGSGGMIGFDAPKIVIGNGAAVFATGGGGGEASSNSNLGNPGADASSTAAAPGGSGGNTNGGDGGAGSTGNPTVGINDGTTGSGVTDVGGGGGGGGGAGLILAPPAVTFGQAAPTPFH